MGWVKVANKKGKQISYPKSFSDGLDKLDDLQLDGEAIGDAYHVFDLLEFDGKDLRGKGYWDRYHQLLKAEGLFGTRTKIVPLAIGYEAKRALYDKLVAGKKEGVVFKRLDAVHKVGKGHFQIVKFKFYSTASVIVVAHNAKNSIAVGLLGADGKLVDMGNVTTIGHDRGKMPVSSIHEIRYLYVQGKGGHFYQPTYLGPRSDVDREECTFELQRIKYKAEEI